MVISYKDALSVPLLEVGEERRLIERWQRQRDRQAMERLIYSHARQVYKLVRRTGAEPAIAEELISEGYIGLICAADRFDPEKGARFSTYAHWWVQNCVNTALARIRTGGSNLVREAADPDESNGVSMIEQVESPDPTPEEQAIAQCEVTHHRALLQESLAELANVEREIVLARSLRSVPETIDDLSSKLGMSGTKLRQIERRALSRLKFALLSRGVTSMNMG